MSSPALLAIAFTISLLCMAGMGYLALRNHSSRQRIRRGLESAVRDGERDCNSSSGPLLERGLNWIRSKLSFRKQSKLRDNLRLAGLRAEWQAGAYQATRLLLPLLALAGSTFLPQFGLFGAITLVFVAYLLPDLWLSSMIRVAASRLASVCLTPSGPVGDLR